MPKREKNEMFQRKIERKRFGPKLVKFDYVRGHEQLGAINERFHAKLTLGISIQVDWKQGPFKSKVAIFCLKIDPVCTYGDERSNTGFRPVDILSTFHTAVVES